MPIYLLAAPQKCHHALDWSQDPLHRAPDQTASILAVTSTDTLPGALQWKKRYDSFSRTPLGKLAWTAFLVWGFYSGLFFRMLNILFLLWWIAPIVLVPLAQRANRQVSSLFDLALCTGPCSCQTHDH